MNQTNRVEVEEEVAFSLFEDAIDKYEKEVDVAIFDSFVDWLNAHGEDENLLANLLQAHPKFGEIFAELVEQSGSTN